MNTTTINDNRIGVFINSNKFRPSQPDLTSEFQAFGKPFQIAFWEQTTQDGKRTYYSGTLTLQDNKAPQYWKLKLYEFRKADPEDPNEPDYRAKDSITLGEQRYYIYGFWRTDPGQEIWLELEFTSDQRREGPSPEAQKFRESLLEKFGKNKTLSLPERSEQPPTKEPLFSDSSADAALDAEPDDIPF